MKTGIRLGSSSCLTALPRIFSTPSIACASPTTVRLSPSCSVRSGVASSCTPERCTRLMLMPYRFRRRSELSLRPLISGRVTMIDREMSWLSNAFQSMSCVFQSFCTRSPKRSSSACTSSGEAITSTRSPDSRVESEVGIETCPARQRREMTKWWGLYAATSRMLLPTMPGLEILNSTMKMFFLCSASGCGMSEGRAKSLRTAMMPRITPTTPSG